MLFLVDFPALFLTLRLACLTTALLLVAAIPLAAWLSSGNSLTRKFTQALVALPLVLPPTVLGFYLLMGLGPTTALGRTILKLFGHPLAFTFTGLVLGSMLYSLPFAVQPLVAAFSNVDTTLVEVARVLGASPWQAFRRVVLPLSKSGMVTAAVLTFAHTVGEFGVVLMIGGDIPGQTRTLSISLYDAVQEANYIAANHTALWLLALSFVALLALYARNQRRSSLG